MSDLDAMNAFSNHTNAKSNAKDLQDQTIKVMTRILKSSFSVKKL